MLIQFGELSINLVFPLIYGLSCYFRSFSYKDDPTNPFISIILSSICEISIGILELISYFLRKRKKTNNDSNIVNTTYNFSFINHKESNDSYINHRIKTYSIIFLISLTNSLFCLLIFSLESQPEFTTYNFQNEIRFVGIFYVLFLSSKIFKITLYFHHKVSICMILISTILLSIFGILTFDKKGPLSTLCKFGLMLLCDLYFSSKHTVEKVLMDNYFISPFYLLFIEGICSIIVNISIIGVFSQINCSTVLGFCTMGNKIFNFTKFISYIRNHPTFCIVFFIFSIGVELFITLTIKIYTPAYTPIFDFLSTFLGLFSNLPQTNKEIPTFICKTILYVVIGFASLLFNEIIILTFCGLNNDIHNKIEKRSEEEFHESIISLEELNLKDFNKIKA